MTNARTDHRALSPREVEIAKLVSEGYLDREIGVSLGITPSTVQVHLGHAYAKLNIRNRTDLAMWYSEQNHSEA